MKNIERPEVQKSIAFDVATCFANTGESLIAHAMNNKESRIGIKQAIDEQPTVDAVPVVHAHWNCIENVVSYEGTFDAYECSHCHKCFLDDLCENNGSDYVDAKKDFKYCPFCGAKMDGDQK